MSKHLAQSHFGGGTLLGPVVEDDSFVKVIQVRALLEETLTLQPSQALHGPTSTVLDFMEGGP